MKRHDLFTFVFQKMSLLYSLTVLGTLTIIFLAPQIGHSKTLIISDIDDTIRVSHVRSLSALIARGAFKADSFEDLRRLFVLLNNKSLVVNNKEEDVHFYYVTNAPISIQRFMSVPHLPFLRRATAPFPLANDNDVFLRAGSKDEHKLNSIKKILDKELAQLNANSPTQAENLRVIFFGDNGEGDPIIYSKIASEYNDRPIKFISFIRNIYGIEKGTAINSTKQLQQIPFVFSLEVATHLFYKNSLSFQPTESVVEKLNEFFLSESKLINETRNKLPSWYSCLGQPTLGVKSVSASSMIEFINTNIKEQCVK